MAAAGLVTFIDRQRCRFAQAGAEREPDGPVLGFHALRVTVATRLCNAGAPLAQARKFMRHSSPELTANVYTKPASTILRGAVDTAALRLHPACLGSVKRGPWMASDGLPDASGPPESESSQDAGNSPQSGTGVRSEVVGRTGIEPVTPGFSVLCSTS